MGQFKKGLIGTFGVGGLYAYVSGVINGYIRGFLGDHIVVKWIGRLVMATVFLTFIIIRLVPIFPQLKEETEISVAQAAEEEKIISVKSEEGADNADRNEEPTEKITEIEAKMETKDKSEESMAPLDDSVLEPSDVYAEKNSSAVFQAYHPNALNYQWEIKTEMEQWEDAPPEVVTERTDELQRKISLLEQTADKEKKVRCRISFEGNPDLSYHADLHILPAPVFSISADEFSAEAGKYVNAGEIPVEVTYHDGKQEVITGLSGLHFLDTEESNDRSETVAGNLQEIITTVRTASDYNYLEAGTTEKMLSYMKQNGEVLEVPIKLNGLDLKAPEINELHIGEFEVSKVDQPVPVTVSVSAVDNMTPVRQLSYAFLPAGENVKEDDWIDEPIFTAEITENGLWTAYCRDKAGNIATIDQELIVVDSKAPVINLRILVERGWCKKNTIYVSAEDSLPIEYRYINSASGMDSGWTADSSKDVDTNGTWTIQVRDAAGNIAEQEMEVANIDTKAPVIRSITEKKEGEAEEDEK